jgi:uncharacterized protein YihD (DUF1040 family)
MKSYELALLTEQGIIISKALKLVKRLADNKLADIDGFEECDSDNDFKKFIMDARGIVNHPHWDSLK